MPPGLFRQHRKALTWIGEHGEILGGRVIYWMREVYGDSTLPDATSEHGVDEDALTVSDLLTACVEGRLMRDDHPHGEPVVWQRAP